MNQAQAGCADGIPLPIVKLNRVVIVGGVVVALALNLPVVIAGLFLIIAPAAIWGRRASVMYAIGSRLFAKQNATAEKEDFRMQRFNNIIAALMLGGATLAFLLGVPGLGWLLSLGVAAAAFVALLGFCVGCFLYLQLKLGKQRFFASSKP